MRTLGIDLSADLTKTAACEVDWVEGTVRFLERPVVDDLLVQAMAAVDVAAIDVPLGWPEEFIEGLVSHRAEEAWPRMTHAPPADREPLRFRLTDLVVRATGAQPLSVSTDRLGVAAMRAARLQHLLRDAGVVIDRSGIAGRVVETYPAAALRAWGLVSSGYKGAKNREARRVLAAAIAGRCGRLATVVAEGLDGCDDDDLDALICALVARASRLGLTARPEPQQLETARREGWIHLPTASVEAIVAGSRG